MKDQYTFINENENTDYDKVLEFLEALAKKHPRHKDPSNRDFFVVRDKILCEIYFWSDLLCCYLWSEDDTVNSMLGNCGFEELQVEFSNCTQETLEQYFTDCLKVYDEAYS